MESNNYESFITNTVEAMLPRFTDRNLVLTMKIDSNWQDFGYNEDGNTKDREPTQFRKTHFLVFHRPSNYTKVLMVEIPQERDPEDNPFVHLPCSGEFQMKQLSDHDSCWRSDGMRWVFKTFCEAWDYFDDMELPGLEGRKIDPMFHYSIFGGSPQYWLLNEPPKSVDPRDHWNTDYIIDFDRRIHLDEISKFVKDAYK
jgi:hypothetical protein